MNSKKPGLACGVLIRMTSCVIGVLGLLSSTAFAQSYIFSRAEFGTFGPPNNVTAADFNGDGKVDLAVTNVFGNGGTVSILLGKPDGTFALNNQDILIVGYGPSSIAAADFNSDGKLDLVVANSTDNTVSVLLGNGDGTFRPQVTYATGTKPLSVCVGDFNRDGKPDLAVANNTDGTVSILLGNGNGSFRSHVDVAVNVFPASVATADFNDDGKPDLVVGTHNYAAFVSILLGNGDGTFQPHVDYPTGTADSLAVADFNGDGKLDVASVSPGGGVSIWLGNGDGTLQPPVGYPAGDGPEGIAAADFNGDGKVDLLVGHLGGINTPGPNVTILLANGDGTFQAPQSYGVGYNPKAVAAADVNGDGHVDVIAANAGSSQGPPGPGTTVSVLLGRGDGTFESHADYTSGGGTGPVSVIAADFNGDGKLDLAVADSAVAVAVNAVSVFLNNGDGTFGPHVDFPAGTTSRLIVAGDFNGDGKIDLAVADEPGNGTNFLSILLGNGDGTFEPPITTAQAGFASGIAVGDFNHDGKLDIAYTWAGFEQMSILLGNGDGTFQTPVTYSTPFIPGAISVADFNGDGKPDLVIDTGSGGGVLIGNGDGTFQPVVVYTGGGATVGDFNGDGKVDLAGFNSVMLGNGDGTFQSPILYSTSLFGGSFSYTNLVAADFNHDGRVDLVGFGVFNTVSLLLGNGDGTFGGAAQTNIDYQTGNGPNSLAVGDFNGDGGVDLAIANGGENSVSLYLSRPVIALFPVSVSFADEPVGLASAPLSVQVSNPGSVVLNIDSISSSGDFAQTNTCGSSVQPGASCAISVTFTPTLPGSRAGSLRITDNNNGVSGSVQTIALTGTGIGPLVSLSSVSLDFGYHLVGTPSLARTLTLANTGTAPLSIRSIAASSGFTQSNNCGSILAVGGNCSISVTFSPTAVAPASGAITITDTAPGSPHVVSVTGIGAPTLTFTFPARIDFGNEPVAAPSAPQTVTLANASNQPLLVRRLLPTRRFAQANNCGVSIAPGSSCSIQVTFTPIAKLPSRGLLIILDTGRPRFAIVRLSGNGT